MPFYFLPIPVIVCRQSYSLQSVYLPLPPLVCHINNRHRQEGLCVRTSTVLSSGYLYWNANTAGVYMHVCTLHLYSVALWYTPSIVVFTKKCPWAEHLTSLPKREVSALSRDYGIRYTYSIILVKTLQKSLLSNHAHVTYPWCHQHYKPQCVIFLSRTIVVVKSYCFVVYKLTAWRV